MIGRVFTPDLVRSVLDRYPGRRWCVAFSGGLDSTVLLHALATLRNERECELRALHVDHGLHPDSPRWAEHCIQVAGALGIPCTVLRVVVDTAAGAGTEAAARDARYAAFQVELVPGEALLTAHHADDQAETVLLALLRGSGPAGLAAMPEAAPLGNGVLLRPLLGCSRDALAGWAARERLTWVDDPSNEHTGFARNFLRRRVLPALHDQWPGAAASLARSALLAAEADALLDTLAGLDHDALADGDTLDAEGVAALGSVRARNLLRHWIARRGLPTPPYERLLEAERQLRAAAPDRVPTIDWPGATLRRWNGRLYVSGDGPRQPPDSVPLSGVGPQKVEFGAARVSWQDAVTGLSAPRLERASLELRRRAGGERIRLHAGGPHRAVKHLLAEAAVPPWLRDRVPLVYADGHLVAVGDLHFDADWQAGAGERAVRPVVVW